MSDEIRHDADGHRYVLLRDGHEIGQALYEFGERGEINFIHTVIDSDQQEHGLGSRLIAGALDDVRATSRARVVATCPFVFKFISEHPEYQDLTKR
ncbi:GNAT family N-acetyltransferase [soil metagenome]